MLGFLLGGLGLWAAVGALLLGAAAALATFVFTPPDAKQELGFWDWTVLVVFTLASLRAFAWVVYPVGDELRVLSPYNLGDMSLHLGLVRYFASGVAFWPPSPWLTGVPLTYPPGPDLWNALLLLSGWDLRGGLVATGIGVAWLGGWVLWRYGGAFAVAALLFGGGLAGFAIWRTWEFVDYAGDGVWKNAFLTLLVPQRGFLFALPAGMLLLWAWRQEFFAGKKCVPLAVQALIYGTLPLFQLHAFLFLSVALAAAPLFERSCWRRAVAIALAAAAPATASVLAVTNRFGAGGSVRWDPFWAAERGLAGFALEFGVALVLAGVLLVVVTRDGDRVSLWLAWVSAGLAGVAFCVPLTAWEWDNTKLLIWCWLATAPLLWRYVIVPLPLSGRISLCGLLFFTGAISLAAGLDKRHGYRLASRSELARWSALTAHLPPETVFALQPDYNHPLLLLGRRAVCGYEGHLWSHGLDHTGKLARLRRLLGKEPGWQDDAAALGAEYLAVRAGESPLGTERLLRLPASDRSD
jgi:hypothetical protein